MPHKTALLDKAIELALNGNESMLRLFLERMLPAKPHDEPDCVFLSNPNADSDNIRTLIPVLSGH